MFETEKYELWHGDCLELMKNIPDKSVDCIITDLHMALLPRINGIL